MKLLAVAGRPRRETCGPGGRCGGSRTGGGGRSDNCIHTAAGGETRSRTRSGLGRAATSVGGNTGLH